ncbi:IS110 family RNA-guided transposase [Leucobacter sp. HY1910]
MFTDRTCIGLDVHARSIHAYAISPRGDIHHSALTASTDAVLTWISEITQPTDDIAVAYEAGPTGFTLARALTAAEIDVVVAAPSKLLRPSGDRIKTDARDALLLARLLRMDELTAVRVPTLAEEAARDLVRARDDARRDLMAARHRLSKLLLRYGLVYPTGKTAWTKTHDLWLRRQRKEFFAEAGTGTLAAFDAGYDAVTQVVARKDRLDASILESAATSEFSEVTNRLATLRGVSVLTAFALAVEIGDWHRFTGRTIASFLGLVPSEHSSGQTRSLGAITKTGNTHARRLLIESAWHHKSTYTPSVALRARWERVPARIAARGDAGNRRLHHRWEVLVAHKKKHTTANTAVARELAGWCWSLAVME